AAYVALRHVLAAHEHLAVLGNAYLDAVDRLADGPAARRERMIQRDDGRRLGEAVALHHEEPETSPERLERRVERRRAHHRGPELPAERPMHPSIAPPPPVPPRAGRGLDGRFRKAMADVFTQHVEDLRYAHEHRHPPVVNLPHDLRRRVPGHEDDGAQL